ncbi:MAG: hypothetical protein ABJE10_23845 [bacterium]
MNKRIRKKRVRQTLLIELAIHFPTQEDAIVWLDTPMDQLEGRSPRVAISAGEVERVTLILDELNVAKA